MNQAIQIIAQAIAKYHEHPLPLADNMMGDLLDYIARDEARAIAQALIGAGYALGDRT